jgi:hypothetical protein
MAIGPRFEDAAAKYIWAEVERQYRDQADERVTTLPPHLPDDFDTGDFIERLRKLRPFEAMVLLDAIERYWVLHIRQVGNSSSFRAGIDGRLLVEAGLLSEALLKGELQAREHEGKPRASGKVEIADFARALRASTKRGEVDD